MRKKGKREKGREEIGDGGGVLPMLGYCVMNSQVIFVSSCLAFVQA